MDTPGVMHGHQMIEIEKKYRLPPAFRAELINRLNEFGAVDHGEEFEENVIYGGHVLHEKNAVLRIRKTPSRTLLTFKQRAPSRSDVKHQLEYESEFTDADSLREILSYLGLTPRLIYEKRRHTWKIRDVEVVLDELPFGEYMEIEGSITGIKEAEMLLDLEDLDVEHETYPRLTARFGTDVDGRVEARFSKFG